MKYLLIFLVCLTVPEIFAGEYVELMNNGSGLYFDTLGYVKISKEPLFIETTVNISSLRNRITLITEALKIVNVFSSQIKMIDNSTSFTKSIKSIEELLSFCNYQFINLYRKRSKRCNGFTNFFTHCLIKNDNQHSKDLLSKLSQETVQNNQTTVSKFMNIQSEMEDVSFNLKDLRSNQAKIQKDLQDIRKTIEEEQKRSAEARIKIKEHIKNLQSHDDDMNLHKMLINNLHEIPMPSLLDNIHKILETVSERLRDISNSINFAKSNKLDTAVVSHDSVLKELVKKVDNIADNSELPFPPTSENIQKIMDVSQVSYTITDDAVKFILRIPLVSKTEFIAYNYWPMPITQDPRHSDTFIFIQPNPMYTCLALSRDKLSYTYIDSFKECIHLDKNKYLCETERVISTGDAPTCETRLLTEPTTTVPEQCNVQVVTGVIDIWHKLKNKQWIFVQTNINRLTLQCDKKESEEIEIIGSGILTVPSQCSAHTKSQQLVSNKESESLMPRPKTYLQLWTSGCCTSEVLNNTLKNKKAASEIISRLYSIKDVSYKVGNVEETSAEIYLFSGLGILLISVVIFGSYEYYKQLKGKKGSFQDLKLLSKRNSIRFSMYDIMVLFKKNGESNHQLISKNSNRTQEIEKSEGCNKMATTETQNRKILITKNVLQHSGVKSIINNPLKIDQFVSKKDFDEELKLTLFSKNLRSFN